MSHITGLNAGTLLLVSRMQVREQRHPALPGFERHQSRASSELADGCRGPPQSGGETCTHGKDEEIRRSGDGSDDDDDDGRDGNDI